MCFDKYQETLPRACYMGFTSHKNEWRTREAWSRIKNDSTEHKANLRGRTVTQPFLNVFQLIVLVFWPADERFWFSLTAQLSLMPFSETPDGLLNVFCSVPNNIQKQHVAAKEPNVSLWGPAETNPEIKKENIALTFTRWSQMQLQMKDNGAPYLLGAEMFL